MQPVSAMGDWSVEGKWHSHWKPKDEQGRVKKACIGFRRIYVRQLSVSSHLGVGRRQSQEVAVSGVTGRVLWGRRPLACISPRFHL